MIEYNILNPSFFIKAMKAIKEVVYEGYLEFGDGIRLFGIGPSRIQLFELTLGNDILDVVKSGYEDVPLDLGDLYKVLDRFKGGEIESLKLIYDDNCLTIRGKVGGRIKTFKRYAVDIDYRIDENPIPKLLKLPLDAVFKVEATAFIDCLKDCELFAEIFTMESLNDSILISSVGNCGTSETELPTTEIYSNQKASYSIPLVKKMLESTYNNEVIIMFKTDHPIAIHDKISDTSRMVWFLGPRVDDDD